MPEISGEPHGTPSAFRLPCDRVYDRPLISRSETSVFQFALAVAARWIISNAMSQVFRASVPEHSDTRGSALSGGVCDTLLGLLGRKPPRSRRRRRQHDRARRYGPGPGISGEERRHRNPRSATVSVRLSMSLVSAPGGKPQSGACGPRPWTQVEPTTATPHRRHSLKAILSMLLRIKRRAIVHPTLGKGLEPTGHVKKGDAYRSGDPYMSASGLVDRHAR